MLHPASSTTPGRPLSYFPPTPTTPPPPPLPPPFIARVAILDALRRPGERDSCGEIELNLEMNIESNELSTSQPATTPEPPSQPSPLRRRAEAVTLRPSPWCLSPFSPIGTIDSFRVIYLFAFQFEIDVHVISNRRM